MARRLALALCCTPAVLAAQAQPAASVRLNRTIELLANGQATFGIFSHDRSLVNARSLARSGLDFVFIDMEHGALDIETPDNEGNGLSRALPNVLRGRLPRGELGILVLATLQTPAPPGCASVGEPGPPASQFYC
jgi:hypothetical protein